MHLLLAVAPETMTPELQWGAYSICAILLGILFWMIRRMMESNDRVIDAHAKTAEIIERNTQAIRSVGELSKNALDVSIEAKDKLNSRPCIRRFEPGNGMAGT